MLHVAGGIAPLLGELGGQRGDLRPLGRVELHIVLHAAIGQHDELAGAFQDGKIVEATSSNTEAMNRIFDTDEGARYVGEFAIGLNPYVNKPMLDTLFDEKIAGSIHFTPGNSYDDAPNGNHSRVHWDIVLIQTRSWGGGEIYFDGELVRRDGVFVLDELKGLNPENLV